VENDDQCAECGGRLILDPFRAELVCDRCSVVVAGALAMPTLETTSDVEHYYSEADDTGMHVPQLHFSNRDAMGKPVEQRMVNRFRRTAQIQNLKSRERSAITFETRIRRLASQRAIPAVVVQRAIFLSRAARKNQAVKKPSLQGWAFSLLLAACRELRFVVTIEDLVGQDEKELSNVRRYYNLLKKSLNLRIHPPSVTNYVTYFSGKFNFNAVIAIRGTQIAKEHKELNSAPHCVAASALYIAAKEYGYNLSQKSFCQKVRISEITLRNWVATLGGYKPQKMVLPEPKPDDLEEKDERADGEQDAYNHTPEPTAPEEPERDDDDADHGKEHADERDAQKEVRNRRVRKFRRAVKHASYAKKKTANRDDTPVKHRSTRRQGNRIGQRRKRQPLQQRRKAQAQSSKKSTTTRPRRAPARRSRARSRDR